MIAVVLASSGVIAAKASTSPSLEPVLTGGKQAILQPPSKEHELPAYELPPRNGSPDVSTWAIAKPEPLVGQRTTKPVTSLLTAVTQCTRVRVLVVVYTNTAGGTATQAQIDKLKTEVEEARLFYWRNSHMKCYLEVSYLIIDEYKPISDFWEVWPNAYWMGPGPVEPDLRERGMTTNQFSSVINFYAWGQNGYGAAFGGGAYGVNAILGCAAYVGIPFCWDPNTNDWFFIHEFHHTLDSMWDASGYPAYPHADLPIELPGDFGEGYDFNAFILRTWPVDRWVALSAPWANPMTITDTDGDGVPDSGDIYPLSEAVLNSDPVLADTDSDELSDLGEAMAGIFTSSSSRDADSDHDGISDGLDRYPIYRIEEFTPFGTRRIDDVIESGWHVLGYPLTVPYLRFTASIRTNWDSDSLYLAFVINEYAKVHIYLDANNDGWFHGKDNYEIIVNPSLAIPAQVEKAHIWDCSPEAVQTYGGAIWDDDSRYTAGRIVKESDIRRCCTPWISGAGYNIELAIPKNSTTQLLPGHGDRIGLRVTYDSVNGIWSAQAQAFERDVFVDLVLVNASGWKRDAKISTSKARADGQVVDLIGKTVSAVFDGMFYVQEEDRSSGIKVTSDVPVAIGDKVRVIGQLATNAGERELQALVVEKLR